MFSGGIGSWATAKRVAKRLGPDELTLLFADVKGDNPSPHVGEDPDVYRFIKEAAANVGAELVTVKDGRDIWQVFKDKRFLGNSRLANCSHLLKQKPCRDWLEANCDPENTIVYVGIDWSEIHRVAKIKKNYLPYFAEAPLTEPPYLSKDDMLAWAKREGLEPPSMYAQGFPHANCGGGCVRAGQAQFALLHRINPERFQVWENQERELREYLDKDVAILREDIQSKPVPLTLTRFRERIESQPSMFDALDFGGCGCFTEEAS
jgi:3'-phosphoadenosine 5'-phosphosulfate sulfotransferase (PAPS reductase)/FAD synthetase